MRGESDSCWGIAWKCMELCCGVCGLAPVARSTGGCEETDTIAMAAVKEGRERKAWC